MMSRTNSITEYNNYNNIWELTEEFLGNQRNMHHNIDNMAKDKASKKAMEMSRKERVSLLREQYQLGLLCVNETEVAKHLLMHLLGD